MEHAGNRGARSPFRAFGATGLVFTEPACPSSVLAVVTTLHLALAALRNHRSAVAGPVSGLTLVSLLLAGAPWLLPSAWGLAAGVVGHAFWFAVCERWAPAPPRVPPRGTQAAVPAHGVGAGSARPSATRSTDAAAPAPPRGFVQTPVLATFDETPDIKTIRLARPEGFAFEAGQFVPVRLRVDGKEYVRCYSISSSPHSTGYLEISVKRQGLVSNALHATARPGGILSVKAPNGAFRYPAGDDRPIVLVAAGVGITPLVSMLRHAVQTEPSRPVTLLYGARDEASLAFRDELASIARRQPQVRIVAALTRSAGSAMPTGPFPIYPGRIDLELLRTAVPDVAHSIALLCGPAAMIADTKALLTALGVPPPQIRHEIFEAAVAVAVGAREAVAAGRREATGQPGGARGARPAADAGGLHEMRCLPAEVTVPVNADQSLLEAAESAGVELPSLCRAGVCGTCRIRVTDGQVDCESTTLDASDLARGYVLACVARARTSCTVEV